MKKIESFDVNNEGEFIILVDNSINVYDSSGSFLKNIEFEKAGSSYAFFTEEGGVAIYHFRTNKLYLLDEMSSQFYEAHNVSIDFDELENSIIKKGVMKSVQNGENTFNITIPTLFDFFNGKSSVKIRKITKDCETVIFDDGGMIYCDYYISVIVSLIGFIMFFVFILFLVKKTKAKNNSSSPKD